jgi:hypothetical protein
VSRSEASRLQGGRLGLAVEHLEAWSFSEHRETEAPTARILAVGHNYLATAEAPEPLKHALLLAFDDPVRFEGLEWRFAIATIRYVKEPFERLARGQPITAHVRYVPPSAVEAPDPFVGTWSDTSPFLIAKLNRLVP